MQGEMRWPRLFFRSGSENQATLFTGGNERFIGELVEFLDFLLLYVNAAGFAQKIHEARPPQFPRDDARRSADLAQKQAEFQMIPGGNLIFLEKMIRKANQLLRHVLTIARAGRAAMRTEINARRNIRQEHAGRKDAGKPQASGRGRD